MLADIFKVNQKKPIMRLALAAPLFGVGLALTFINFDIIWRYFAWGNQTLSAVTLWAISMYLVKNAKPHWVTTVPALLMTAVTASYLLQAKEGFMLPALLSNIAGVVTSVIILIIFMRKVQTESGTALVEEQKKIG